MNKDRLERIVSSLTDTVQANAEQIAQNTRDIGNLRAFVSDVREIQAEQAREFDGLMQVFHLSLVRMSELHTLSADLEQRISPLENE